MAFTALRPGINTVTALNFQGTEGSPWTELPH